MSYNHVRSVIFRLVFILLGLILFGIVGCSPAELSGTPTFTLESFLTPYWTATPGPGLDLATVNKQSTPVPTEIPLPTATPFIYIVVADDTLIGIASRYTVSLEDLIAANPGLDPNFLTIGLTLTIPLEGVSAVALPTPTSIPIQMDPPNCYAEADGSLQCIVMVENNQSYAVENVVIQISLQSANGDIFATQTAIPPLNLIPAGRKAAVSAIFKTPSSQGYLPQARLLMAIPVAPDSQRYLSTDLQVQESRISPEGLQANLKGSVALSGEQPDGKTVWVAAFAYDENENIVGFRKWVSNDVLAAGGQIDFDLMVFSLGPAIMRLELLAEARP